MVRIHKIKYLNTKPLLKKCYNIRLLYGKIIFGNWTQKIQLLLEIIRQILFPSPKLHGGFA